MKLFKDQKPTGSLNESFIMDEYLVVSTCGREVGIALTRFTAEYFDSVAFEKAGIQRPASISRSVRKRQAEFFYGRSMARLAMRHIGCGNSDVPIGPSGEPVWPSGIVGSITHTDGMAAAAVAKISKFSAIGIDVERIVMPAAQAAVTSIVLCEKEISLLQEFSKEISWAMALTLVFSAKESLFKAAFASVGQYFNFDVARITYLDIRRSVLNLVLEEHLNKDFPQGLSCEIAFRVLDANHVLTIFCVPTN